MVHGGGSRRRDEFLSEQRSTLALAGITEKLAWASAHFEDLGREVRPWLEANPPRVVSEYHDDAQILAMRGNLPEAPLHFGVMAGNIIHHLRSALDHLVWQLVIANGGTPKDGPRGNAFPIYPYKISDFDKRMRHGRLQGVRRSHRAVIENLQPYTRGHGPKAVLALLSELDNAYKHQVLTPVVGLVDPNYPRQAGEIVVGDATLVGKIQFLPESTLEHDAIVGWVEIVPTGPHPHMDVEILASRYTAFPSGAPVLRLLDTLGQTVAAIIDAFTPCFDDIEVPPDPIKFNGVQHLEPKFAGTPMPWPDE